MEKRGASLIQIDEPPLRRLMAAYFDKGTSWDAVASLGKGLTEDAARFDAKEARQKAQREEKYDEARIVRYATRPFDHQHAYYTGVRPVWNEPRPGLWSQRWDGNEFFVSRRHGSKTPEGPPFYWTRRLLDDSLLTLHATAFPARIKGVNRKLLAFTEDAGPADRITNNYSDRLLAYLEQAGIKSNRDADSSSLVWLHALAIGFAPKYLQENRDGIRQDWPRIPLPKTADALRTSAALGRKLADLLDADKVPGINKAPIRPELERIGRVERRDGNPLDPDRDLDVTVQWGRPQQGGVFPGPGRAELRDYTQDELTALQQGAQTLGVTVQDLLDTLGPKTYDVYLNPQTYWANIPQNVWDYHIGGYQVIKKWLSYRETALLGRPLTAEEAAEIGGTARRLAAILLLQPALNANYKAVEKSAARWPTKDNGPARHRAAVGGEQVP